jgi:hypothetical protein
MKTIITNSSVLIIVILLLTSCFTSVSFNKPAPPEIMLEEPKNNIAFINAFDYTIPDEASKSENNVYRTGVTEVIDGLKTSFAYNEQIDFNVIDTLAGEKAPVRLSDTLSADSVKNICKTNNSSMLLVLEAFDMNIDFETLVEEYEDGSKSRTNNYYLVISAGLSLYSSSGDLIDRSMDALSSLYTSRPALSGIITFTPSLYKAEEEIGHLAKIVGEEYVKKFYPGTELVNRKIYVGKGLLEADNYCMEQNWDKAIELLRPLAESPDPKISRKAANNLSVAYEAVGNEKAAEYWFNKSMEGGK